ncbi:hypothetical protein AN963_00045 [Brevibacillus choshinensis]|uniref:LuxR family transcriptional regulator n=1 Tax=Brevibacillus choshinensis TaxID=54911 RepID=A0ABR5N9P4_BRECH|nr:response regulator transcription factor [Brevibacillus choshinensis]KQL48262.1 hypothetical protein AN963_00045 [Brevibacillus choshinensis]
MSPKYRIVVADDQTLIRSSLVVVLENQHDIEIAGQAVNGHEAIVLAAETQPHLILMDIRMPVVDGIEATRRILSEFPDIKIVALTTFEEDELIESCMSAGAVGYLLKDLTSEELISSIRLIRAGGSIMPTSYVKRWGRKIGSEPVHHREEKADVHLTEREREELHLLMEGCSNKEMAGRMYVSETTIKNHLSSIFAKMEVRDRTQAVIFAIQNVLVN